jgi:hypothetical protein
MVERSRKVVIDLHSLLLRPLTFSGGKETSVHSSYSSVSKGLLEADESALHVSTRGRSCSSFGVLKLNQRKNLKVQTLYFASPDQVTAGYLDKNYATFSQFDNSRNANNLPPRVCLVA